MKTVTSDVLRRLLEANRRREAIAPPDGERRRYVQRGTVEYEAHPADEGGAATFGGILIPFNTPDMRPGLMFDEADRMQFYDYSVFAPGGMDVQLALDDPLARVRLLWQHGGFGGGIEGVPIGSVTRVVSGTEHLFGSAELNDTFLATQVGIALRHGDIKELSTALDVLERRIERRPTIRAGDDDAPKDGLDDVRVITKFELFDMSPVMHAQFVDAIITEVRCDDCGVEGRYLGPVCTGDNCGNTPEPRGEGDDPEPKGPTDAGARAARRRQALDEGAERIATWDSPASQ